MKNLKPSFEPLKLTEDPTADALGPIPVMYPSLCWIGLVVWGTSGLRATCLRAFGFVVYLDDQLT